MGTKSVVGAARVAARGAVKKRVKKSAESSPIYRPGSTDIVGSRTRCMSSELSLQLPRQNTTSKSYSPCLCPGGVGGRVKGSSSRGYDNTTCCYPSTDTLQSILITQDATTNTISYNVVRGALVYGFGCYFFETGPWKGDIVLSVQELKGSRKMDVCEAMYHWMQQRRARTPARIESKLSGLDKLTTHVYVGAAGYEPHDWPMPGSG